MSALGLPDLTKELSDLLLGIQEPPPGTDEIAALAKVIDYLDQDVIAGGRIVRFDRVVLDTAPTGHTLRMLQLPQFMLDLTAKLRTIRKHASSVGNMLGGSSNSGDEATFSSAEAGKMDKLASFDRRMRRLQEVLHNPQECEFTAVTIPTELATAETVRLLDALRSENVTVRRLIINQVLPLTSPIGDCDENASRTTTSSSTYLHKLRAGQGRSLQDLNRLSTEAGVALVEVPYFDTEVRTVCGLRLVSGVLSAHTL